VVVLPITMAPAARNRRRVAFNLANQPRNLIDAVTLRIMPAE